MSPHQSVSTLNPVARAIRATAAPTTLTSSQSPFSQAVAPTLHTQYISQLHILQTELAYLERRADWFDVKERVRTLKREISQAEGSLRVLANYGRDSTTGSPGTGSVVVGVVEVAVEVSREPRYLRDQ